jgi:hypothetical protein
MARPPGSTDHGIAGDQRGEGVFIQRFGAGWSFGQHEVAEFGGRVPDPHGNALVQGEAEVAQYAARIDDSTRPVGGGFVPDRRQSQH